MYSRTYKNKLWFFGHPEVLCETGNILGRGKRGLFLKGLRRHLGGLSRRELEEILAGLIDSEGSFSLSGKGKRIVQVRITMHKREREVLEYLRERIGGGKVIDVKGKEACVYVIWRKEDVKRVAEMINGRLRLEEKREKYNERIVGNVEGVKRTDKPVKKMRESYWLSGMVMGDGSLQIKVLNRGKREEVRLGVQMDIKGRELLEEIKEEKGGNIGYRKSQDTYYYSSTNFESADKWVSYLDKYKMIGPKYEEYKLWREVWEMIKNREHLNNKGVEKIKEIKKRMSGMRAR